MTDTSWMVNDYPEPPREKAPVVCARCCEPFTLEAFYLDGQPCCEECFREWIRDEKSLEELADALFIEHEHADYLEV